MIRSSLLRRAAAAALGIVLAATVLNAPGLASAATPAVPGAPEGGTTTGPADPLIPDDENPPRITISPSVVGLGEQVAVQGVNFPPLIAVQANICGNYALNGSADCIPAASANTRTTTAGVFVVQLTTARPPKPCPCVVVVTSPTTSVRASLPITLRGVPTATPQVERVDRSLDAEISLERKRKISAWFGGSAEAEVVLSVVNTGSVPLANPLNTVTLGRGDDPTSLIQLPPLGEIPVNGRAEVRQTVSIDAPAFGRYTVKAVFGDLQEQVVVRDSVSTYPWGLIVLVWLLLQIPLLGLYKRRPVLATPGDEAPASTDPLSPPPAPAGAAADVDPGPDALVSVSGTVFGVSDLRAYLDPADAGNHRAIPRTKIVISGPGDEQVTADH